MKYFTIVLLLLIAPCAYTQVTDFDDIANLKFWFEADSVSGLSDGESFPAGENTWGNLVYANGDSGFTAVDPRYPSWEANEINTSKSAVLFDSSTNAEELRMEGVADLNYSKFTHQWDKSIFVVLKIPVDNDVSRIPLDSRSNGIGNIGMTLRILDNGSTLDGRVNTHAGPAGSNNFNFNSADNAFAYGPWQIVTVWASTTDDTARTFVDGVQVGKMVITGVESSNRSTFDFSVGRTSTLRTTSIKGYIALIVMYDRALTDEERCQVRDLISCRFPDVFADDAGCAVTCPSAAPVNLGASVRKRGLRR